MDQDTKLEVDKEYSVSELTGLIKVLLETTFDDTICVIGEISNYKISKGSVFFTLKDEVSTISVVMWNYLNRKTKIELEDGKKVKVYGNLNVYGKSGSYNLKAYKVELLGVGNLFREYLKLKEEYTQKGYFSEDIKKKLPTTINKIGIITAKDGAALQDFLYVLTKNEFCGQVHIKNCSVQGKECPKSVVNGINLLDSMKLDVLVVARGGGSFEDLFGFSDGAVIEAIHNCNTCIISAIGHEIDFMLSDYVADIRAPTPSIAGEIISGKRDGVIGLDELDILINNLQIQITNRISYLESEYSIIICKIKSPLEIIDKILEEIGIQYNKMENIVNTQINKNSETLNQLAERLNNIDSPFIHMKKGYCLVYKSDGTKITTIKEFMESTNKRKKLKLKFVDGEALFDIRNINIITND